MPLEVILGYFQTQDSQLNNCISTIKLGSHRTNHWTAIVSACLSALPSWGSVLAIVCGSLTAVVDRAIAQTPRVRVAYIIPSDRSAQSGAVANLQQFIPTMRDWYAEQMDRYGFGEKSFIYETEPDGVTPLIHVVPVTMTASDIRSNSWNQTLTAASNAGVPLWTTGQVWLLIPESHLQASNGSIAGGVALGASFGSGMDPGVALIGGDALFRLSNSRLTDNATYQGQVVPQIGPFPLVQSVSFPWFEGNTFSSIASSIQGAAAHELGHAFGLGHDFRNDSNFRGNLMGNGLRGWRGSVLPDLYPNDDSQLSYAAALALNTSRYFNGAPGSDQVRPNVTVSTTGLTPLVDGKLLVNFTASDASGLAAALLSRDGNVIDELVLSGTAVSTAFATPYFTSNQSAEYLIRVYDTQGNVQSRTASITPQGGDNVAPQPFLSASPTTIVTGQSLFLSATGTVDPNHSLGQLQFEWDVDGDGIFTAPSSQNTFLANFNSAGPRLVRVRVTDPQGAWAVSAPLAVRVISGEASISQSYVYYSGSPLEAGGIEAALDTSKSLVRETSEPQTLDFTSLINSHRGINGLVFDIDGLSAATLSPVDFMFQISPQGAFNQAANPPVDWQEAPSPSSIVVQSGSPARVILKWPDNSINNRWLRLTIKANSSTGLVEPAVFYLGHLLGETSGLDGGIYTTAFADIPPIRSAVGTSVNASSLVDIDKNGLVTFADISAMRVNVGSQLTNITVQSE
jgi:hypothetical protein